MVPTSHQQQVAAESLYRDANSLLYADNKPSDEAIDRVIGKINQEYVAGLYTFPASSLIVISLVSTSGASSPESARTRTQEISHISMRRTASSTRRYLSLAFAVVGLY
jgi:hypothetical protein